MHNRSGYVPNVEQRGRSFHFAPFLDRFACSRKKAIRFLCMPFASLSFNLSPFSLHIFLSYIIYIYILSAPFSFFFFFFLFLPLFRFSFSHLSPPSPFSLFFSCSFIDRITYSLTRLFTPDLRIFIRSRTLGNSLVIRPITVSDRYFFHFSSLNLLSILLVEYSRYRYCKFIIRDF